jgi:ketosteroid isomerase-like protein
MGANEDLELVRTISQAKADEDFDTYRKLLADDAVFRMAGVPDELNGTLRGADAIVGEFRRNKGLSHWTTYHEFAGHGFVCVTGKTTVSEFPGGDHVKGSSKGYETDECVVYSVEDGRVTSITAYINWLHALVQAEVIGIDAFIK